MVEADFKSYLHKNGGHGVAKAREARIYVLPCPAP